MEKKEADVFLDDVQDVFGDENKDPQMYDFGQEKSDKGEADQEEKPKPYHKDPEFKKLKAEKKEAQDRSERLEKEYAEKFANLEKLVTNKGTTSKVDDVVGAFEKIIGNDTPEKQSALEQLRNSFASLKDEVKSESLAEVNAREREARKAEEEAEQFLDDSFEQIEENYNVDLSSNSQSAKRTRNEFINFIQKISPKNAQGEVTEYPDVVSSFEVFQSIKKAAPSSTVRAKDLASRGMSRSNEITAKPPTHKESGWDAVSRMIEKMTS